MDILDEKTAAKMREHMKFMAENPPRVVAVRERKLGQKGVPNCRHIFTEIRNGREWTLHATKGWRSRHLKGE